MKPTTVALTEQECDFDSIPSIEEIMKGDVDASEKFLQLEDRSKKLREIDDEYRRMLSRKETYLNGTNTKKIMKRHNFPPISTKFRELLKSESRIREFSGKYAAEIDPEYIKDGFVYVFRGDYPGLEKKGIFSHPFRQWGINLDQTLGLLDGEELSSHFCFDVENKLEELMWTHSLSGWENFISSTPRIDVAKRHPFEVDSNAVYLLKVPVEQAFKAYSGLGGFEEEILIVDYVLPENIIKVFDPNKYHFAKSNEFMR